MKDILGKEIVGYDEACYLKKWGSTTNALVITIAMITVQRKKNISQMIADMNVSDGEAYSAIHIR